MNTIFECKANTPHMRLSQNVSSPSVSVGDPLRMVNFQRGFPPGTRGNDKLVWF
jgi:hypothetical protein